MSTSSNIVDTSTEDSSVRALLPAVFLAMAVLGFSGFAFYAPPTQGEMGVVFSPWTGQAEAIVAITAAGGRLVNATRIPNIMIAYGSDSGFAGRVRAEGAWFTVAAKGLCGASG